MKKLPAECLGRIFTALARGGAPPHNPGGTWQEHSRPKAASAFYVLTSAERRQQLLREPTFRLLHVRFRPRV